PKRSRDQSRPQAGLTLLNEPKVRSLSHGEGLAVSDAEGELSLSAKIGMFARGAGDGLDLKSLGPNEAVDHLWRRFSASTASSDNFASEEVVTSNHTGLAKLHHSAVWYP